MLNLFGKKLRTDGQVSRRQFLTAGALGVGGWSLADLLRAESEAGIRSSTKSILNIHLDGGPPQLDTIDPKPDAPVEIRGDFASIATRIPGIRICETLPQLARIADHVVFVRSLTGSAGAHDAFQCQSGYSVNDLRSIGGRPAMGSVIAKLLGSASDSAPSFIDLMQGRPQVRNSARPGFLGPTYSPFRPDISRLFARELEPGMKGELARRGENHSIQLTLVDGMTPELLDDRTRLLAAFDSVRRELDASGTMSAMDRFTQQAASILTSGRFANALDLSLEPVHMQERYATPVSLAERFFTAEDGNAGKKLLLARRLLEAGVRCVSVSFSDFDTHSNNFPRMRQLLPIVDRALHALVTDLEDRGMLNDVAIVVWGEFGRTPRIDPNTGGRHHWPEVGPALLLGGGLRGGQVIGATDRHGGRVVSRPVRYQDIFATLYRTLGINALNATLQDTTGRPQFVIDQGTPLAEVF